MKDTGKLKKKSGILKKSIAIVVLFNMMYMTALPVVSVLDSHVITSAAASTTEIVGTAGIKTPELALSSAILIEASTGQVLLSMNPDEALPPASMTKMMTEYIVAEEVKQGRLKWDDVVTVGKNAAESVGSRIFLAEGDKHTVRDLYIAMAVGSANDATVALAERVAGSEQNFVEMMNETAQRMGMKDSYFINATGLDKADMPKAYQPDTDRETVMTARDVATLAGYIVRDHPDYTEFTTLQNYKFRPTDKDPIVNWNWMLEANKNITNFKAYAYEGLNGMKTGHTNAAGYCFAGTAVRDGMTLISVAMGADTEPARFKETRKILDYGFENFKLQQVVAPKAELAELKTVPVTKGKETEVPVVTKDAVSFVVPKNGAEPQITHTAKVTSASELLAPLKQGDKVGTVTYTYKAKGMDQPQEKTVDLITTTNVEEAGWFRMFFRAIGGFFADLFGSIKNLF
ncbi:D-alanyl-D-alanine carboxypeptidase [Paenibacillus sp. P96]|uniref:serine-type D-Ala-D-Ala carboxypeptidase n=1 Tax=Paenibacillus zeirhizosphaerae TaxID=2987519 RepID=A0ABT9FWZ9_9BACL|nr:D-alanyl-D-alanine carboxypeptidase family protein [Paenibacillus sp. P96]MDP4099253.1 D-alanyl-D-alanine carboxypeptidase [Paenibacillus sp. P96]